MTVYFPITHQQLLFIIMRDNKIIYSILFCLIFFSISLKSDGQSEKTSAEGRGEYALVAYISGGIGYYATHAGTSPFATNLNKWGPAATIRILWHPDHLLRVGFETGHTTFYSYQLKDSVGNTGKTTLTGIPLLLVTSMPVTKRLHVYFGTGFTNVSTNLNYKGKTSSNKLSVSWMLAASYIHPISKNLGIGTEVKWLDAAETADASASVQLQLVYKFLKW